MVGVVIPNPAKWLLPEFQDIGWTLQTMLQLPLYATVGHGFTLSPPRIASSSASRQVSALKGLSCSIAVRECCRLATWQAGTHLHV